MRSSLAFTILFGSLVAVPALGQAQIEEPATGFTLWVRTHSSTIQEFTGSVAGAPQFTVGVNREQVSLGVGIGLTRLRSVNKDFGTEDTFTATLFQLGPSALIHFWHSSDMRTRGNIALGAGIGRLSATDRDEFIDFNGVTQVNETKTTGTLFSIHFGLGGDYFLSPHFALGTEGGFQGSFSTGIEEEGTVNQSLGLGAIGAYGSLRAMIVF